MSKSVSDGPRGDFLVVNFALGFPLTCTLKAYDGNRTPPHPILFFTLPDDGPSTFPDREAAELAIARTLAWYREQWGWEWPADQYAVWTTSAWAAIRTRRRTKRRPKEEAHDASV